MTNGYIAAQRRLANRAEGGFMPSEATLERAAQLALTGGFNTARSNRCPNCFTTRSANGSCSCD